MKSCFGYIRVSTQKQGEGVSLVAQKDAIQAFASHHNLTITKWFEEKETAAKSGRPIFNQMLKLLQHKAADGLIVHKIDRSARNLKDWAVISDLSDAGVDVYFATESLDFRSRGGRLTADIQAVIAADFIRNLREETKKGINGRLKQGLFPFRAPIGYLDTGKGNVKLPDPRKAPLIKEMFSLYASGQYTLRSLRTEMDRRDLRNHNNRPISLHGVEVILRNSFYYGLITIRRTGMTYDGLHQPLITPHVFRRVQEIKAGRYSKCVTRHNHLYRGLFRCGLCAAAMTPELQKGRVYYRCQTLTCQTKTIREDGLESHIIAALERLQLSEEAAAKISDRWQSNANTDEIELAKAALKLKLADEKSRLVRLTDLFVDGQIDNATFQERQRDVKLRLADIKEQIASCPDPGQIEANRQKFLELMKNLVQLHEIAEPDEKRVLVENCFSNRRVVGRKVELEPYNWLLWDENDSSVPIGAPERDSSRTLEKLLEFFHHRLKGESRR